MRWAFLVVAIAVPVLFSLSRIPWLLPALSIAAGSLRWCTVFPYHQERGFVNPDRAFVGAHFADEFDLFFRAGHHEACFKRLPIMISGQRLGGRYGVFGNAQRHSSS